MATHKLKTKQDAKNFLYTKGAFYLKKYECWIWKGRKNKDGYGIVTFNGKPWGVHRLSAYVFFDNFDPKLLVLHLNECHNPACFNPNHLYQGTIQDNVADSLAAGTHVSIRFRKKENEKQKALKIMSKYFTSSDLKDFGYFSE